ncbi:MAG: hypothetical protein JSV30_01950 [Candidatus Omnitrophota bacterium]|nr:MAG: hypothetical protein JSV30_01950 [Candidatus Omnitrophota bacterium]
MRASIKDSMLENAKLSLKVILGIILLAIGAWLIWLWKEDVWTVIRGFLGIIVILSGAMFLAIAKE